MCSAVRRNAGGGSLPTTLRTKARPSIKGLAPFGALALGLGGCALPRHSLLLENRAADSGVAAFTRPIPETWDGRLLRVGSGPTTLGGEATHAHAFAHVSQGPSGPASVGYAPLGITESAAAMGHVHLLVSQSQSPSVTGPASNLPPARALLALVVTKSQLHPIPGEIVGYLGDDVPKGWVLCNGQNGAPDMQGLYVALRRGGVPGVVGADTHQHDATHAHGWGVAVPDPKVGTNLALHLDTYPAQHPTRAASPVSHTHAAAEPVAAAATTSAERVRPPTFEIRFIQATAAVRKMPIGAIVGFDGGSAPLGWSSWTAFADTPVTGRFLAGSTTAHAGGTFGTETHTHTFSASHHVVLVPGATGVAKDVEQAAPPVAASDHAHTADIAETGTTQAASHIPPFVAMTFLIKN
jgi:hypothetical protein